MALRAPAGADGQKKTLIATEQDRPEVARFRRRWQAHQHRVDPDRLVFLDETWIRTDMTRVRGWCQRGTPLLAKVPHGRWRTLTFIAGLATGIAGAALEAMGEPYVDAMGVPSAAMLGQPVMIFAGTKDVLRRAYAQATQRGLMRAAYVRAMFSTGHDAANYAVFAAEPADAMDLVGLALCGARRDVDKAIKGARPHP